MKRLVLLGLLLLGFSGCVSNEAFKKFVNSSDAFVNFIADDYVKRIKADTSHLNSLSIITRIDTIDKYKNDLEEAKKKAGM